MLVRDDISGNKSAPYFDMCWSALSEQHPVTPAQKLAG